MSTRNDLDTPTTQREYKAFATLQAQLAMYGQVLVKTDPAIGGQVPYFVMHWGLSRPMQSLDAVREYLASLLGACAL